MQVSLVEPTFMAVKFEKKEIPITMKVSESIEKRIGAIAHAEDRPKGYIARELMIRGMKLYDEDGYLRDVNDTYRAMQEHLNDGFDLDAALNRSDDPMQIMTEWFRFEGRDLPADYGLQFFRGWETYSPKEKADTLRDAKSLLDRTLKAKTI